MDIQEGQDLIFLQCNLLINLVNNYTSSDSLHVHSNLKKIGPLQVPGQLPWKR